MTGQVRGTGERVTFTYEQGLDSDVYRAKIGDETFQGKAVMDGAGSFTASTFGDFAPLFGSSTTNKFYAVMLGNRGNSLSCQMRYTDSGGFTSLGGVGMCKHSDGRTIDIIW